MKFSPFLFSLLLFAAPAKSWSDGGEKPPEVSLDGLELVEKSRRREIYRAPDVDWSVYEAILIDEATVSFRRNWQRDQNRNKPSHIRKADMDRISTGMAELFDDVFTRELTEKGDFTLATAAEDNVLQITPFIVDLDVYAPDPRSSPGIQRSYVESAGRMTLKLHLYDSVTGDLLAVFSDHREAPRRGYMQWANTVSNTQEFRLMLQSWARDLREGLEEAQAQPLAQ
jgi:hypothetical protein